MTPLQPPAYSEDAIREFTNLVRTLTGVHLLGNDAYASLERIRNLHATPEQLAGWRAWGASQKVHKFRGVAGKQGAYASDGERGQDMPVDYGNV
jgi:hypothetical protein